MNRLKTRLTPVYFTNTSPRDYNEKTLMQAAALKFVPERMPALVNPIASNPEMDLWAKEITKDATNDVQKAKMLFDTLARHLDELESHPRTAQEVFADWNAPEASFHCMDYTFLYVALARAVGLKSYCTDVREAYDGSKAWHACAAIFLGDKLLLIDPAYFWFGAPHKKFVVLDDLQTMAFYMSELSGLQQKIIACRLAPDFALLRLSLLNAMLYRGGKNGAQEQLSAIMRLEPEGDIAFLARGEVALFEGNADAAVNFFQKAIQINPSAGVAHRWLGDAYLRLGKLNDARESYRKALTCILNERDAEDVRRAIAQINEMLVRAR